MKQLTIQNTLHRYSLLGLLVAMLPGPLYAQAANPDLDLAKSVATGLTSKQYHDVANHFDANLAANLSEQKVQQVWEQLTANAGNFKSLGDPKASTVQGMGVVDVIATFDNGAFDIRVNPDGNGLIGGIWVTPLNAASAGTNAQQPQNNALADDAKTVAQNLVNNKVSDVRAQFNDTLTQNLSEAMMKQAWATMLQTSGDVKSVDSVSRVPTPQDTVEQVKCTATNSAVLVTVAYDSAGKIDGLWIKPVPQ